MEPSETPRQRDPLRRLLEVVAVLVVLLVGLALALGLFFKVLQKSSANHENGGSLTTKTTAHHPWSG